MTRPFPLLGLIVSLGDVSWFRLSLGTKSHTLTRWCLEGRRQYQSGSDAERILPTPFRYPG